MNLYTVRIGIQSTTTLAPRGAPDSVMSHHAELPDDGAARAWGEQLAEDLPTDVLSSRWLATRGTNTQPHRVTVYRRTMATKKHHLVWEGGFDLGEPINVPEIPVPGTSVTVDLAPAWVDPDPRRAVVVVEGGYAGTSPVGRRVYVGPVAPLASIGYIRLSADEILPGVAVWGVGEGGDAPPTPADDPGLVRPVLATQAAQHCAGIAERAAEHGGRGVIVRWSAEATHEATHWRSSHNWGVLRSRGNRSAMYPPVFSSD